MKKLGRFVLLLPMLLGLGACSTDDSSLDISSIIDDSDVQEMVKNFIYDTSVANASLNQLAQADGYSFTFRASDVYVPDKDKASTYYDIELNGKGNLTWATVTQTNKNRKETYTSYQAVYEEDTKETYVNDGNSWYHVTGSYDFPYSVSDLKALLIVSGQYVPFLIASGVVKTRTIKINRECIKYNLKQNDDELTIVVDRKTQILTELIDVKYVEKTAHSQSIQMEAFKEVAPAAPNYK